MLKAMLYFLLFQENYLGKAQIYAWRKQIWLVFCVLIVFSWMHFSTQEDAKLHLCVWGKIRREKEFLFNVGRLNFVKVCPDVGPARCIKQALLPKHNCFLGCKQLHRYTNKHQPETHSLTEQLFCATTLYVATHGYSRLHCSAMSFRKEALFWRYNVFLVSCCTNTVSSISNAELCKKHVVVHLLVACAATQWRKENINTPLDSKPLKLDNIDQSIASEDWLSPHKFLCLVSCSERQQNSLTYFESRLDVAVQHQTGTNRWTILRIISLTTEPPGSIKCSGMAQNHKQEQTDCRKKYHIYQGYSRSICWQRIGTERVFSPTELRIWWLMYINGLTKWQMQVWLPLIQHLTVFLWWK